MKLDPFRMTKKIKNRALRNRALDFLLNQGIPFNQGLGFRLAKVSPEEVVVHSPVRRRRQNHIGGAHACALALLGEYPAGLVVVQNFSFEDYRPVISGLKISYHKQGRGMLTAVAKKPLEWPDLSSGEGFVDMKTVIENESGELVAECVTNWQIKSWKLVRNRRQAKSG